MANGCQTAAQMDVHQVVLSWPITGHVSDLVTPPQSSTIFMKFSMPSQI